MCQKMPQDVKKNHKLQDGVTRYGKVQQGERRYHMVTKVAQGATLCTRSKKLSQAIKRFNKQVLGATRCIKGSGRLGVLPFAHAI